MIQVTSKSDTSLTPTPKVVKAVGLISGGLDSSLACKIIKDLGVEVHGIYFSMPWGCCDKTKAQSVAQHLGIPLIIFQLDERYLELVKNPKYGYGSGLNPCVDCRIHMFSRAGQYMRTIGADFVFTGEVLGQRPMSQMTKSLRWIEDGAKLERRLLRPLSAQLLQPTIPEEEGLIDRQKLLQISGRSRSEQIKLAKEFDINDYPSPAGGCLLTDPHFSHRMKDTLAYGYRNFRETISLKWGRHFRINPQFKAIVGRDERENEMLTHYAHPDDLIFQLSHEKGPTLILKGHQPANAILSISAGLVQRFSRYKDLEPQEVNYWPANDKNLIQSIQSIALDETYINQIKI